MINLSKGCLVAESWITSSVVMISLPHKEVLLFGNNRYEKNVFVTLHKPNKSRQP